MTTTLEPLQAKDAADFAVFEEGIAAGKGAFLTVGMYLVQIRDRRLYRATHATFEEYLEKRWDISKSYGYRLIAFAKQVDESPIGDKPKTEHQARKSRQSRKQSSPAVEPAESDPPHIRTLQDEDSAPPVESSASFAEKLNEDSMRKARDQNFLSAVGMTSAENFFASQIEDIWTGVAANGTDAQILATISECKRAVMNLKIELSKRMGRAA